MDLPVDKMLAGLFSKEAEERPSDRGKPDQLVLELPPWFDEKEFDKARRFYWANCFTLSSSMLMGLIAVFAVPSILAVLVASRRSSSTYTAYKRYLSTMLHVQAWFEYELKPGSTSWKSLHAVRSRHLSASSASTLLGRGPVSQRDLALTQFGFFGFALLKPDKIGALALEPGDWKAFIHFWRTIGYMIGIEDRYNLCRETEQETRQVCQYVLERVFTPAMENVPEYFEHMARVMLDGMWSINPTVDCNAALYYCKYLADVPGYITTESERVQLYETIRGLLNKKHDSNGVEVTCLIQKPVIGGLPDAPPRRLRLQDYEVFHRSEFYKQLSWYEKYRLNFQIIAVYLCTTFLGRLYFNLNFLWSLILMKYFPFLAFHRFGFTKSFVNIFKESPVDDTKPLPNSHYQNKKLNKAWYSSFINFFKGKIQ